MGTGSDGISTEAIVVDELAVDELAVDIAKFVLEDGLSVLLALVGSSHSS